MFKTNVVWQTLSRVALVATVCVYLFHPAHETYGQDFFYYRSLAQLSRQVSGPEFYHSQDKLIAIESAALGEELRRDPEIRWQVSDTWVRDVVPRLRDPRFRQGPEPRGRDPGGGTQEAGPSRFPLPAFRSSSSRLPMRYYPEWASLRELSQNEFSKVSPATFGLLRVIGIDRVEFRDGYRIWNFVTLLALLGSIALIRKFAGLEAIPFETLAVVALWFDPCRSSFVYGQFTEIALLATALFLYLRFKQHPRLFAAGFALGVSIAIKPLAAGLVLFLIWNVICVALRRRALPERPASWKEICGLFAGAATVMVFFEGLLGRGIWSEWMRSLPIWYGSYTYTLFSPANRSAAAALASWFSLEGDSTVLKAAHMLYVGCVLALYGWFFLHPRWRALLIAYPQTAAAMALLGPLVISKFVLIQYEIFLLVPFAVLLGIALSEKNEHGSAHEGAQRECEGGHGGLTLRALLLVLWFGFGFYESFPFLLWSRPEFFLYPVLLITLGSAPGERSEIVGKESLEKSLADS